MKLKKGQLIVIEGADGSGKETQSLLLKEALDGFGHKCVIYSFPRYNTPTGKEIKKILTTKSENLFTKIALFANDRLAARDEMYNDLIDGKIVICDRYITSMIAYGSAEAKLWSNKVPIVSDKISGIVASHITTLEMVQNAMPVADIQFFLSVPIEILRQLLASRSNLQNAGSIPLDEYEKNIALQEESLSLYKSINSHNTYAIAEIHSEIECYDEKNKKLKSAISIRDLIISDLLKNHIIQK
jgi:dTMP kinase